MKNIKSLFLTLPFYLSLSPVFADGPKPWQMGFQEPATPVMEQIVSFHDQLLVIEILIASLVAGLLFFVIYRFRASKNPTASKNSHNALLEMIWTVIPVIILLFIAFPSFKLLYYMDIAPQAQLTVKAVGNQWYWTYEYPDQDINFDSHILEGDELKAGQKRLLDVDQPVVVPVNTDIRLITTARDVIHSWAIPAFGVKKDCIPGRLNETWFRVKKEGKYYGQCSELCGAKHGFMPIVVEAVSQAKFDQWVAMKKNPSFPENKEGN